MSSQENIEANGNGEDCQNREFDPVIAEETEKFLREALEASNRFGIPLTLPNNDIKANESTKSEIKPNTPLEAQAPTRELKQELQARLRRRIEEKEARTTNSDSSPLKGNKEGPSSHLLQENSSMAAKNDSSSEISSQPSLDSALSSEKMEDDENSIDPSKKEEENVEGFLIFCDEAAPKENSQSPSDSSIVKRKKTHVILKIPKSTKLIASKIPTNGPVFGPQVVRKALSELGGRASAVAIAEWISSNRPQYLNYFGSQKKLRYSVSGILSARTYSNIFQKKLIIQKGIRKADWVLMDPDAEIIEENPFETAQNTEQDNTTQDPMQLLKDAADEVKPVEGAVEGCQICNQTTDDDKMLLCDQCDLGYHLFCLNPPLAEIPHGPWFCDYCARDADKQPDTQDTDNYVADDVDVPPDDAEDLLEGEVMSPRACDKHRWKKRCPESCPLRNNRRSFGKKDRKRKVKSEEIRFSLPEKSKKVKVQSPTPAVDAPTYIDMIEEAIEYLGGKGTTPDITNYMEENHLPLLATKTRTWRNSVSGCLSTHFIRAGKDKMGRTVWAVPKDGDRPLESHSIPVSKLPSREVRLKAPSRFSQRMYDPNHLEQLRSRENSSTYREIKGIQFINRANPLQVVPNRLSHPGCITKMALSENGNILASVSTFGTVRLWDLNNNYEQMREIKDKEQKNIEEFYSVAFVDEDQKIIVGSKIKDKQVWNKIENDNQVLPGVIKVFNLNGDKVCTLEGHASDVLFLTPVKFDGSWYVLSGGQDGKIMKWLMNDDFTECLSQTVIADQVTQIVPHLSFVPGTGNKFFIACCDNGLKLFDFETEQLVQNFPGIFTYLCDCVEFVKPKEIRMLQCDRYLLVRGVEMLSEDDEAVTANSCILKRLVLPENGQGKFKMDDYNVFSHPQYRSNNWPMKLGTNGRYLLAPTTEGKVFVWNLETAELSALLSDHQNREVRDIVFHPTRRLLFTSADDSTIRVYEQSAMDNVEDSMEMSDEEENVDTEAEDDDTPKKRKRKID